MGLLVVILASAIALSAAFPAMHMPLAETVDKAAEAALAGNWNEAQVLVTKGSVVDTGAPLVVIN